MKGVKEGGMTIKLWMMIELLVDRLDGSGCIVNNKSFQIYNKIED